MENALTNNQKQLAAFIHLSTFTKYLFPFANFFVPLILWTANNDKEFADYNGRQALNFQLSILLYSVLVGLICLPFFAFFVTDFVSLVESIEHTARDISVQDIANLSGFVMLLGIAGLVLFGLFLFELYAVITATIYASKGKKYRYPLSIPFIKTKDNLKEPENEHAG